MDPVPVPVERKPARPVPTVGHIPQHEVAVDLVEAIAGIKESRPKTGPRLVAGEFGFLGRTRIDPRGEHALGAKPTSKTIVFAYPSRLTTHFLVIIQKERTELKREMSSSRKCEMFSLLMN